MKKMPESPFKNTPNITQHELMIKMMQTLYVNSFNGGDVTFQLDDGRQFRAHRCVLASQSPVFSAMLLDGAYEESTKDVIELPGKMSDAFEVFLKFIYTCSIELSQLDIETVIHVLLIADEYQVTTLVEAVSQALEVAIDSECVFDIYEAALLVGRCILLETCRHYLCANAGEVLENPNFQHLSITAVSDLVSQDNFSAPEVDILMAVNRWHETNNHNHKQTDIACLLGKVRFAYINLDGLTVEQVAPLYRLLLAHGIDFNQIIQSGTKFDPFNNKQKPRIPGTNVATLENGTTIIYFGPSCLNAGQVLSAVSNRVRYLAMGTSITIKLSRIYRINSIAFNIYALNCLYCGYTVETSCAGADHNNSNNNNNNNNSSNNKWDLLANCRTINCYHRQLLMFNPVSVRYVRITGFPLPNALDECSYAVTAFQCPASGLTVHDKTRYVKNCPKGGTLRYQVHGNDTTVLLQ